MKAKRIREKGKIKLSNYYNILEQGQRVAVVKELSVKSSIPDRIIGRCGVVEGTRGDYKLVRIKEGNKTKTFIIHPIHLKLLK